MINLPELEWLTLPETLDRVKSEVEATHAEIERALKNAFRDEEIATRGQCHTYPTSTRKFRVLDGFLWDTAEILWETNKFRRPTGEHFQVFWDIEVCRRDLDLWLARGKTETADTSGDLRDTTAINQPPNAQAEPSDQPIDRAADQLKAANEQDTNGNDERSNVVLTRNRTKIREFIEKRAATEDPKSYKKADFETSAHEDLDFNFTPSMFREAWRAAEIPEEFKKGGVRSKK